MILIYDVKGYMCMDEEIRVKNNCYSMIFKEYPDIVSIEDLQTMLGIGRNSTYNLIHSGAIKSIKIGRIHKIPKFCVIEYILKNSL